MKIHHAATAALALATALALTGCASGGTPADSGHGEHAVTPSDTAATTAGAADVMFTTMMIPHHAQAVEMAEMILTKDGIDVRVVTLAEEIAAAQGPEIEQMQSWLEQWGVPAGESSGMDHGDGMMSEADMQALDAATGVEASRLFLEQMIVHHEGAVAMAEEQLAEGEDPGAIALAQAIIDAQLAEITTMKEILATL